MKEIKSIEDLNKVFQKEEIEKSISSPNISQETKGCKVGFTITDEIVKEDTLKAKVFKYISYKKRTESEIRQKFAEEDEEILDRVIEYFKSQNYINETEYIERSMKEFFAIKNLSIKELTYKLLHKGVNKRLLDDYVVANREILVNYELESAKKIIVKKSGKLEKEDIKRYLLQKGYLSEIVSVAMEEVLED